LKIYAQLQKLKVGS
jgi:hypothetical protein